MATPITQKHRPIALSVLGGGGLGFWTHVFFIRPEELTMTHPSRAAVIQTLGGAFLDAFGEGIIEININGHTGWRGALNIPGELHFYNLRELIWKRFHRLRAEISASGGDPDQIEMIFTDTLNLVNSVVFPMSFQLRRHRNRPLLYQYQIKMLTLRPLGFSLP